MDRHPLKHIIEAALLSAGKPLNMQHLQQLLAEDEETPLAKEFVQAGLDALSRDLEDRGIELKLVASGYRLQVRQSLEPWIARLFEERPPRYSRALLETLALIGYRQPITRAEIEDVRGVSVSSNIIRTLLEREWIKVVGHRDVPGRPSMYGTTKQFLDYFNLKSLAELPELGELMDLEKATEEFDKANGGDAANDGEGDEGGEEAADNDAEVAAAGAEQEPDQEGHSESEQVPAEAATAQASEQPATDADLQTPDSTAQAPLEESQSADAHVVVEHEAEAEADTENSAEEQGGQLMQTAEPAPAQSLEDQHDDGESQEDIDADVESLIRMLDAEAGAVSPASAELVEEPQAEQSAVPDNSQHEAARGESITPADLLRRHSTDTES